jgi:hypothetical protein
MTSTGKTAVTSPTTTAAAVPATVAKTAPVKATAKRAVKRAAPVRKAAPVAAKPVAAKAANKPAAKPVAKPVATTKASKPLASPKPATKPVPSKVTKVKKPKMVRDSFTIPKPEYDVLNVLKLRAAKLGTPAKKTELIRAGVKLLAGLSDAAYRQALAAVPSLKTGRPAKAKKA